MTYTRGEPLDRNDLRHYQRLNAERGLKPTGETIIKSWTDRGRSYESRKVVFKGRWTPYGCIRDCGDHYIEAQIDRYSRISKDLQTITDDVEDV